MIKIGSQVRLKKNISKKAEKYYQLIGILRDSIHKVVQVTSEVYIIGAGIGICVLLDSGHWVLKKDIEDIFLSNLEKILT